jgi:ribonuclease Z
MGQDRDRDGPPLEIYGPEGLRVWLRASIRYSVSRIVPPYRVHELMDIPMAPEWKETRFKNGRYLHELDRRNKGGSRKRSQWGTQGLAGEDSSSWIRCVIGDNCGTNCSRYLVKSNIFL